jgi:hypothetical protein
VMLDKGWLEPAPLRMGTHYSCLLGEGCKPRYGRCIASLVCRLIGYVESRASRLLFYQVWTDTIVYTNKENNGKE